MGEAEKTFGRGWVAHFGARYTAYNLVKARTVYGLAEKYWGNNRAAYTLYVTNLTNAGTAPTHRFQYNRFFGEKLNSFGAAASFGKEHENLGPNIGILRNQTWSASVSNRYWLSKKIGLNVDASIHRQGDLYYRRSLNFGIRYRF
jgi:YaiO family outer membrane protein